MLAGKECAILIAPITGPDFDDASEVASDAAAPQARWTAIILAGQRPGRDPFIEECGQTYKALIEVAGKSMLRRVTEAVLASQNIKRLVILAQEPECLMAGDMADLVTNPKIHLAPSRSGIATSIAAVAGSDVAPWPVLVTTADHPLLSTEMVDGFLAEAGQSDLAIGVGERRTVEGRYPGTKRTWMKFSDGHYSGANLFALAGADVAPALSLWASIEQDRKKSLSIISRFGPLLLFRALTRTISFPCAIGRAGKLLGLNAVPVIMPQPEAAIDVDKSCDLALVEEILGGT